MSAVSSLVDLDPAVEVALVGALLALLPLAVVAWRLRGVRQGRMQAWLRALTLVTLFLTIDLVVFGAFTRLSDSGLGCPDWPGCYGSASPVGAHAEITQVQAVAPTGPVTHGKAWVEMIHRYLATGVGALITLLMGMAWWQHLKARGPVQVSPWWPTATFVWVCVQGAFGALTVTLKLYPLVVTVHLLGGLLGVALLSAQASAWRQAGTAVPPRGEHRDALRHAALFTLLIWMAQAALGAWVSTNGAVLACGDSFPQCQGQWWPTMDWAQGMTLLRGLGEDGQGGHISLSALAAIHMAHRLGALVASLAVVYLIARAWRAGGAARLDARVLAGLLLWQVCTGLSNVVLGWPLAAALGHTLGAALTVAWLTRMVVTRSKVSKV